MRISGAIYVVDEWFCCLDSIDGGLGRNEASHFVYIAYHQCIDSNSELSSRQVMKFKEITKGYTEE
jgi:hypothetical protein